MTEEEDVNETVTMPPMRPVDVAERRDAPSETREPVFEIEGLAARYGTNLAIKNVDLEIYKNLITAVIGPSGCGKSTFIRCLNRMNDEVPSFRLDGKLLYHGIDLYGDGVGRSRCDAASAWCSRSRIRFPRRSTTTSPGRLACSV
jgi:ABC-type glutathione transport system ATPase component